MKTQMPIAFLEGCEGVSFLEYAPNMGSWLSILDRAADRATFRATIEQIQVRLLCSLQFAFVMMRHVVLLVCSMLMGPEVILGSAGMQV
jgi:hypothetical protein